MDFPKIIFLVIVLSTIVDVSMAVALFFLMQIPVHLGMRLSWPLVQQFGIPLC
jgi:hypothetical protein